MNTLLISMSLYTATIANVYVLTKCSKHFDINMKRVVLFGHYRAPSGNTVIFKFEDSENWCPQIIYGKNKQ